MFPRNLVIVLFLAAQTALLWYVAARDRTSEAHFAWTTTVTPAPIAPEAPSPAPQQVALPASPPAALRPSCPPPRTDATAAAKRDLPRGVDHVATSLTNAGWLAAWSSHDVHVSLDGGATFQQVLDGPGDVDDVTFDCFGHPIVSRGDQIGVRDGTRESWHAVLGFQFNENQHPILIGGGPDIVIAGEPIGDESRTQLAISSDLAASWWYRNTGVYWDEARATGRQAADGTVDIVFTVADCMSDPSTWVRMQPDGTIATDELGDIGHIELYGDVAIATWALDDVKRGIGWKKFGSDAWHAIKGVPDGDAVLVDGPLPRIVVDNVIYTVDGSRAKALRPWPYGVPASVDRAGQLWGIGETKDGEDAWLVAVPGTKAKIPPPEELPSNE
jgi:hypothetical protein